MDVLYPHSPSIVRISPFPEGQGKAVAGLTFTYGPIVVRAKLVKDEQDRLFLSMPSRKSEGNNNWYNMAYIQDRSLHSAIEKMAVEGYREMVMRPVLSAA